MKIAFIVPGFGGTFYCQNCMRDRHLIKQLKVLGNEVIAAPMYLPVRIETPSAKDDSPVFYGAVNVYLKEVFPIFRGAPKWFEKLLNSKKVLNWAAKRAGSTNVRGLGKLTLSVLQGEDGTQAGELDKLVAWLKENHKPDVVHLSNVLLIGLASRIKKELGVKVFCTLQDEDTWIDALGDKYTPEAWKVISGKADDVDGFIAVSRYYANVMKKRMEISEKKMDVVPIGINILDCKSNDLPFDPCVIGYLSRFSRSLGLDILVDAFIILKRENKFKDLKLRATGGCVGGDKKFIAELTKRLKKNNFHESVEFLPDYYKENMCDFLQSLTVLSVPVPGGEAFGTYLIETLSAGVPVVQPDAGAFPEVVKDTGGGILYSPNTPEKLAESLASLLSDTSRAGRLGRHGRDSVLKKYSAAHMAENLDRIYKGAGR